tara:strand:+ start:952 stop:2940 length:1989 start_codon:yes stop_codon:yes gene_type:complete
MTDIFSQIILKSLILKSKGVYYTDANGQIHPAAYHPEHWGEGLAAHHPFDIDFNPENIDPVTGQYNTHTYHPAGTHGEHKQKDGIPGFEHGFGGNRTLWPIEAAAHGINQFVRDKGLTHTLDGQEFNPHWLGGHAIQAAIRKFNEKRRAAGLSELPDDLNDPAWKQVRVGTFPDKIATGQKSKTGKDISEYPTAEQMETHDANGDLITFNMNKGTSIGEPERGPFVESGRLPFFAELKEVLNEWLGRGMSMNFVHHPYIEPDQMNPMMSREGTSEGNRGRRTLTPEQEALKAPESHYGHIAPETVVGHHPYSFFHGSLSQGGRPSEPALKMIHEYNAKFGWGLNDAQVKNMASAPISAIFTSGKKLTEQGKYNKLVDALGQASGLHSGKPLRMGRWKKGKEGTPEDLESQYAAYNQDPTQWEMGVGEQSDIHSKHRGHTSPFQGEGYGQGTMHSVQNALATFGGAHELGIDLDDLYNNSIAQQPLHEGTQEHSTAIVMKEFYKQIALDRIKNDPEGLGALKGIDFSQGHPEAAMNEAMLPTEWQSVPSSAVVDATHGQTPQPTMEKPSIFQLQEGPSEVETRLLKAMEDIQLADAKQNVGIPFKKSLNINNHDDVLVAANRLEITIHDVHSISAARGDWQNIAKLYQLPPSVVSTVKVAFGG